MLALELSKMSDDSDSDMDDGCGLSCEWVFVFFHLWFIVLFFYFSLVLLICPGLRSHFSNFIKARFLVNGDDSSFCSNRPTSNAVSPDAQ